MLLTHAHAARAKYGPQYPEVTMQRRNLLANILRQAAGNAQLRAPMFLVDAHPDCPVNPLGQPVVADQGGQVAWKQTLQFQLLGNTMYQAVQEVLRSMQPKVRTPELGF